MDSLIDSHCHLTFDELREQVAAVLERAAAVGVKQCVTVATDLADAERALRLSEASPSVHVVAGVHPHEAGNVTEDWAAALKALVHREDVYAVGETGLDYHYDFADRDSQKRAFQRQLEIASEACKPVVIHCREAQEDVLALLADFPALARVVFHCFTGTLSEARALLDRGYWISLTGVVTFKKSSALRQVAKMIPDDRLMIETDSPYLSPEPVRREVPNEPAHLVHTAKCIAQQRGISLARLATLTAVNTRRFFSLSTG